MLPSERIQEIFKDLKKKDTAQRVHTYLSAVIEYLDEQYEKNKPCEHKEIELFVYKGKVTDGIKICKKCKDIVGSY